MRINKNMADDSFSDCSEDECPEQDYSYGYPQVSSDNEADRWSPVLPHGKQQSSPKQKRFNKKFNFGGWKLNKFTRKKKSEPEEFERVAADSHVFGVPLEVAVQRSIVVDGIELPTVFRQCIDFLEENALREQGLYRLPGVKSQVDQLKNAYDGGELVDLSQCEIHTVASLLKQFLRELQDSIFTAYLNPKFDEVASKSKDEEQIVLLKELIDELPLANRTMITWFMIHIGHVIAEASVNLMSIQNMIVVFQPTLQTSHQVLYMFISNTRELFEDVKLTKYIPPEVTAVEMVGEGGEMTEDDIEAEIQRLEYEQGSIHAKLKQTFDSKADSQAWEITRTITELRRKLKVMRKLKLCEQTGSPSGRRDLGKGEVPDDQNQSAVEVNEVETTQMAEEHLAAELQNILSKTEESLLNERDSLLVIREVLKEEVEMERKAIATLKEQIDQMQDTDSSEESGDEAVLEGKFLSALKEVRDLRHQNAVLNDRIMEEVESIALLQVVARRNK